MSEYSEITAAFDAGMAQSQREQDCMADPMGSAVPLVSDSQPEESSTPLDQPGGVT